MEVTAMVCQKLRANVFTKHYKTTTNRQSLFLCRYVTSRLYRLYGTPGVK